MIKILAILFSLSLLSGCSSSSYLENALCYVESVNTRATNEYDLITCRYNSKKIRIVVKRLPYSDCNMIIQKGTFYKLDLQKIDTVVHATTNIQRGRGKVVVSVEGDIYFYDDTLVGELYSSPDLNGICIINPNIFHYP